MQAPGQAALTWTPRSIRTRIPAPGFKGAPVSPAGASYSKTLREFILPYDAVRTARDPDTALLAFLQSTYEAAANAAHWDRAALECAPGRAGVCRRVP